MSGRIYFPFMLCAYSYFTSLLTTKSPVCAGPFAISCFLFCILDPETRGFLDASFGVARSLPAWRCKPSVILQI
jgi:hypothetical protein